jgi:excisionase family DNA binding protein
MDRRAAAEYLSVEPSWLRDHREVPHVQLGRLVRYRREDLDAFIEAQVTRAETGRSVRSRRRLRAS